MNCHLIAGASGLSASGLNWVQGGAMDVSQIIKDVADVKLPPGEEELALHDIAGWDSLKLVRLVIRLEEILKRELSESEIESLQTIRDVARVLGMR